MRGRLNFPAEVLTDLVALLSEFGDCQMLGHTASISLNRVLSKPWSPGRLERCRDHLARGEKAPPIHVSRYILLGKAYYSVGDGNHRCTAAREAGHTRIWARIGSQTICHPERYWLNVESGSLWRELTDRPSLVRVNVSTLSPAVQEALLFVGVNPLKFN